MMLLMVLVVKVEYPLKQGLKPSLDVSCSNISVNSLK